MSERLIKVLIVDDEAIVRNGLNKIEVSMDGKDWRTALDQSGNQVPRNVLFDEIAPVECRYVRLTMLN
ncbi:MAG: hypothetical protein II516_02190, partial [Treponema sp.]|nr:hypothetical protein [Treponema sp.]